jgi:hypothetical protein
MAQRRRQTRLKACVMKIGLDIASRKSSGVIGCCRRRVVMPRHNEAQPSQGQGEMSALSPRHDTGLLRSMKNGAAARS